MSETIELAPCPFCGSDWIDIFADNHESWVACQKCAAYMEIPGANEERLAVAWNRRSTPDADAEREALAAYQEVRDAHLSDDEINVILAQKPLLTYLTERKAALEWSAESAAHTDDDKNLRRYRAEIADLDRYIESTKSLVRAVMARPLPNAEREALLRAWRMLENGATRTAVIEAIANTLGINELPND